MPSLDEKHLRQEQLAGSHGEQLQSFVPAEAPYLCPDPAAPALVLVPGLGMDSLGFIRQLPLGRLAHLHLFQTPNRPVEGEAGLAGFAAHVEDYVTTRRLDQHPGGVVLGGCSMGGAVSLATACRGRVPLRGLILLGTFGSCRHLPCWQRWSAPLAWVLPMPLMRLAAWQLVARSTYFGAGVTPTEADWLVSSKQKHTQRYFALAARALTRQHQLPAAARLQLPTLVMHGTEDHVLPYAAGQELAETIPGAKLVTVERSGHALFFMQHAEVNAAMAAFLTSLRR